MTAHEANPSRDGLTPSNGQSLPTARSGAGSDAAVGVSKKGDDVLKEFWSEFARIYLGLIVEKYKNGKYEYQSSFAKKYVAEGEARGEARGKARAVIAVLDARGIAVSDEARARIKACSDPSQLDGWVRLAVTAGSAEELFD